MLRRGDKVAAIPGAMAEWVRAAAVVSEIWRIQRIFHITVKRQPRSEEHTSELQSPDHIVCRLLLEKKKKTTIGDDEDSHLRDFIEDTHTVAPADAALQAGLQDAVKELLETLTPREAKVLRKRFGIEMSTDYTLEEVGKQFDVTRERIRQIEAKAMRKSRHPSRSDKLKPFLEGG